MTQPAEIWTLPVDPDVTVPFTAPEAARLFRVPFETRRHAPLPVEEKGPIMFTATKCPAEELDYGFDWGDWLNEGETIEASGWSVSPNDDTLTVLSDSQSDTATSVWLLDGTVGVVYTLTNTVFTDASPVSRHPQRSFQLLIVASR